MSFLVCSQNIFAQLEKGMKSIGLSSRLNYNKNNNNENATITSPAIDNYYISYSYAITPTVSYFLSSKFSLGLSVGYVGSTSKSEETHSGSYYIQYNSSNHYGFNKSYNKDVSNGISVSPFLKYYVPLSDNVFFFLKGGVGTTFSQIKSSGTANYYDMDITNNTTYSNSSEYPIAKKNNIGINVGISPGILFMPTPKIGLEFSIGNVLAYNYSKEKTIGSTTKRSTNGFQFLNINSMSVGTAIYYFF